MPDKLDEMVDAIIKQKVADFKQAEKRDPTKEEREEMRSSAFATAQAQLKKNNTIDDIRVAINSTTSGHFKNRSMNGRKHIVTAMVPIVGDTVMNSGLYPEAEVASSYLQLNNLPAPKSHPKIDGFSVSAFHPAAINSQNIGGFIRNPKRQGKMVVNEFWLDIEVANRTPDGLELIHRIENKELVGVSTGLTLNREISSGTAPNGQAYDWIGHNFKFDHVAILLNEDAAGKDVGTQLILNSSGEGQYIQETFIVNCAEVEFTETEGAETMPDEIVTPPKKTNADPSPATDENKSALTVEAAKAFLEQNGLKVIKKEVFDRVESDAVFLTTNGVRIKELIARDDARIAEEITRIENLKKEITENSDFGLGDLEGSSIIVLTGLHESLCKPTTIDNSMRGGTPRAPKSDFLENYMAINYTGREAN